MTVGASGSHSVCVCTIHENVNLMISSVPLTKTNHELVEMIVCDRKNKQCMIHRCPNCPGTEPLEQYLKDLLLPSDVNDDEDQDEIKFKKWTTTDSTELVNRSEKASEFIELLVSKLDKITTHSYIAKSQASFLKKTKNELGEKEVIVLGDFAENYQFVVQDEIQGFQWNKTQCTLHPIMVYYKNNGELQSHSICYISDDITHDVDMVYQVLKLTVDFIKRHISEDISTIHYLSDSCAAQYKNCKKPFKPMFTF